MADTDADFLARGQTIVHKAESALRAAISEAAEAGAYNAVDKITDWAKQMRSIVDGSIYKATPGKEEQPVSREPDEYPKFYKSDDELVMIGLSRDNTEYEHKAPKAVLDQVVSVLMKSSKGESPTPIKVKEGLLPRLKAASGSEVPEYYVRTFLRWLRNGELLSKHGHAGYSVKNPETFEAAVNKKWRAIPEQ
jgi:hypothetical protein